LWISGRSLFTRLWVSNNFSSFVVPCLISFLALENFCYFKIIIQSVLESCSLFRAFCVEGSAYFEFYSNSNKESLMLKNRFCLNEVRVKLK
jgi:hypothetical protein